MVLLDLVNLVFGIYKGYMNASGVDVDPVYSASFVVGYSTLCGAFGGVKAARYNSVATGRALTSLDELLFCNSAVKLIFGEFSFKKRNVHKELNPYAEGGKFAVGCACESALEITLGYGIGYVAQKVFC